MVKPKLPLSDFQRRLPPRLRRVLSAYLDRHTGADAVSSQAPDGRYIQPYWMYLPFWILSDTGARRAKRHRPDIAAELVWAQLCLFYVFRLQDDVFDDPGRPAELLFVANAFLDEASATFRAHFHAEHPFWRTYRQVLRRSSDGMIAVREHERGGGTAASHAHAIRAVNGILLLGAHAAASMASAPIAARDIDAYGGAMGLGGQLIDDLTDLQDDLQEGRLNLAARIMCEQAGIAPQMDPDGTQRLDRSAVARRIRALYRTAGRIGGRIAQAGPSDYAQECILWLDRALIADGAGLFHDSASQRPRPWPI
jgi:hypothetical protein